MEHRTALDQQAGDRKADYAVGRTHFAEIDPRVGNDARADACLLRACGGEARVVGKIVEIELRRVDGRIDLRPPAAFKDRRLRAKARASDRAGERVDEPVFAVMAHLSPKIDILRPEQPCFDDVIELLEIRAAGSHFHAHVAQVESACHRAFGVKVEDGGCEAGRKGPRGRCAFSGRSATAHGDASRRAIKVSARVYSEASARLGLDRPLEVEPAFCVAEGEAAIFDRQVFEGGRIVFAALILVGAASPIAVAFTVADEDEVEAFDVERADIGVARKKGEDRDLRADAHHLEHFAFAGPSRLGDLQVAHHDRGREREEFVP
ncbi:MAG TPA: hypothetical protein VN034_09950 [Sphingopyxis sp.]|nr:hypothetical protein [Sphingopyxis sp.]